MLAVLPEEVWAQIFSLLRFEERLSRIPLVCKGWDQIAKSHGSVIWQGCVVDNSDHLWTRHPAHDYFKVLQWLRRHGEYVKSLCITDPVKQGKADETSWQVFRNGLVAMLVHTPHLEVLRCHGLGSFFIPENGIYILKRFLRLRSLCLGMEFCEAWNEATLHALCHLTCLDTLSITVCNMDSASLLLAPELSQLTGLTCLSLRRPCTYDTANHPEPAVTMPNLVKVVANLTNLSTLVLHGVSNGFPDSFASLKMLRNLTISDSNPWEGPAVVISPALIACSNLEGLCLTGLSTSSAIALPTYCSIICQLPSLRRLKIRISGLSELDAATCDFNSSLTELELACDWSMLPPSVLSITSLATLEFCPNFGCGVPVIGPYLDNLTSLRLSVRPRDLSPEFLKAARSLETLSLFLDEDGEEFLDEEAESLLAHVAPACCLIVGDDFWDPPHV